MHRPMPRFAHLVALALAVWAPTAAAQTVETPDLQDDVAAGGLPPVAERLPELPAIFDVGAAGLEPGRHGGEITWLARRARDVRIMNVYGYARLVGYTEEFELEPDILRAIEVEDDRVFTLHLRPGHRWSNGDAFTSEDFRYFWEDIQLNEALKPYGPDSRLIVEGEPAQVTIIDEVTVEYRWSGPNPEFLSQLAGARPLYVYAPATYLSRFHADHADPDALAALIAEAGQEDWTGLHLSRGKLYDAQNVELPTLQPWVNVTPPPAERFTFARNPYFHRVDENGRQLPYLDRVVVTISDASLIPAKTGAGDSDLQARSIRFDDFTFLQDAAERNDYTVNLWTTALGSEIAIHPNLTVSDPGWRALVRDVRFRRALSLGINRHEINQILFFGLATPVNNSALPASPVHDADRAALWTEFDPDAANALLDEMGLTERNGSGIRLMADGRPIEIIMEMAGERSVEQDVLELIADTWGDIGIAVFANASQRDLFRTRIFSGEAAFSMWTGFDNGLFVAATPPVELAPVDQNWLHYPAWGQYRQTAGEAGEAPDMELGIELMELYEAWRNTPGDAERLEIVGRMLDIHADQQLSIGVVQGVFQPVVVSNRLRNVPGEAVYSWDPGGHFGIYRPDIFWLAN